MSGLALSRTEKEKDWDGWVAYLKRMVKNAATKKEREEYEAELRFFHASKQKKAS